MPESEPMLNQHPTVDPEVFSALHDSFIADGQNFTRTVTRLAKEDSRFVLGVFKEGHDRSDGDHRFEEAFAQGAFFALEGLERTQLIKHATAELEQGTLSSDPDALTTISEQSTDRTPRTRRLGFGRISAALMAFSLFRKNT